MEIAQRTAHDLRTPLRHVISYTGLLQERLSDTEPVTRMDAGLQKISDAARRLQRCLDELAALARVRSADLQLQELDMAALARKAWSGFAEACPNGETLRFATPLPAVQGDAELLQLVWGHLMKELLGFAAGDGRAFSLVASGRTTRIGRRFDLVLEGAVGAQATHAAGIGDSAPDLLSGTGSRALVRRILGAHGGHLRVLLEPGQAPGFRFWLPG